MLIFHQVHAWNLDFVQKSSKEHYDNIAKRLDETLSFMAAMGISAETTPQIRETEFLHLP